MRQNWFVKTKINNSIFHLFLSLVCLCPNKPIIKFCSDWFNFCIRIQNSGLRGGIFQSSGWPKMQLVHGHTSTVGQNNQKYRLKYRATRSSVRSFARTAHSFACSELLALLMHHPALAYSLTSLTPSLVGQWMNGWLFCLCFFLFSTTAQRPHVVDFTQFIYRFCCFCHLFLVLFMADIIDKSRNFMSGFYHKMNSRQNWVFFDSLPT